MVCAHHIGFGTYLVCAHHIGFGIYLVCAHHFILIHFNLDMRARDRSRALLYVYIASMANHPQLHDNSYKKRRKK